MAPVPSAGLRGRRKGCLSAARAHLYLSRPFQSGCHDDSFGRRVGDRLRHHIDVTRRRTGRFHRLREGRFASTHGSVSSLRPNALSEGPIWAPSMAAQRCRLQCRNYAIGMISTISCAAPTRAATGILESKVANLPPCRRANPTKYKSVSCW